MRRGVAARGITALLVAASLSGCFAAPPQIIAIEPNRGSTSVVADQPVTVVFDRAVDKTSLPGRFHISPGLPNCNDATVFDDLPDTAPCHAEWLTDRPGFMFVHEGAVFAPDTTYQFSLDAGVRDTTGVVNNLDHRWDMKSQAAPLIASTTPNADATDVPIDGTLAVEFDRSMDPASTAAAISISPSVPGLRVVRNELDKRRFAILPGVMLSQGVAYTVTVAATAADEHRQPLGTAQSFAFTAGRMAEGRHAAVLVRHGAGPATSVLVTATAAHRGEPVPAFSVTSVPQGLELTQAALSPGGALLAVVVTSPTTQPLLRVIDSATGIDRYDISGGSRPAWSSRGDLAYSIGGRVTVRRGGDSGTITLPAGDPLVAAPVWSPDGTLLALPVAVAGKTTHIDLASPVLTARYPLPGFSGALTGPVISAQGLLAVHRDATTLSGAWIAGVGTNSTAPAFLDASFTPLGFAGDGVLIGTVRPATGAASLARLALGGSVTALPAGPVASDLDSAAVAADGRQIGYLAAGPDGVVRQAWIENGDGGSPLALTTLGRGDEATAIALSA